MVSKQVEILRRLLPKLKRILLVGPAGEEFVVPFKAAAARQRIEVELAKTGADPTRIPDLAAIPADGTVALYVSNLGHVTREVIRQANARKLPTFAYTVDPVEDDGALVAYALEFRDPAARLAVTLDRILKGARPADLPAPGLGRLALDELEAEQKAIAEIGKTIERLGSATKKQVGTAAPTLAAPVPGIVRGIDATRHEALLKEYGLDRPVLVQYGIYIGRVLHGDLGKSMITQEPVLREFLTLFPATIELAVCAILFAILFVGWAVVILGVFVLIAIGATSSACSRATARC